jgi:iron-sulfur cluster assembly protein
MQAEGNGDTRGLRLGVRGGGCSGFSYFMEFAHDARAEDIVYEHFGLPVYVDPKSHAILDGTELDYVAGIQHHGFKWKNPNEASSCGCGLSFNI